MYVFRFLQIFSNSNPSNVLVGVYMEKKHPKKVRASPYKRILLKNQNLFI